LLALEKVLRKARVLKLVSEDRQFQKQQQLFLRCRICGTKQNGEDKEKEFNVENHYTS
jgi:hypothetical protein